MEEEPQQLDEHDKNQIAKGISNLLQDLQFQAHMRKVEAYAQNRANNTIDVGDEEYSLVTKSNEFANIIEREIMNIHKYARDIYIAKFPELESIILNPLEYAKCVKEIKNEMDLNKIDLSSILQHHTIMAVNLAGSSTSGKPLSEKELLSALRGCDLILQLDYYKRRLLNYVESRMQLIAPNLSAVVDSSLAAQLMAAAGGITPLANMPACNIQVLGAQKKNMLGFSKALSKVHLGLFGTLEMVKNAPPSCQIKLVRMLATNCAKAARVDLARTCPSGSIGRQLNENMLKRFDKIQEPAPAKLRKPLPIPDDKPRKRRGGKKYRNMKAKMAMSEVRKFQNRINFGEEAQQEYRDTGIGMGLLGKNIGKVRVNIKNNKMQLTKKQRSAQDKMHRTQASGLASSIAFTPMRTEIELVNPDNMRAPQRREPTEIFSKESGFKTVLESKKGNGNLLSNILGKKF